MMLSFEQAAAGRMGSLPVGEARYRGGADGKVRRPPCGCSRAAPVDWRSGVANADMLGGAAASWL